MVISIIQLFLSLIDFVFSVHNDGCCVFICFFENNFFVVNVNNLLESPGRGGGYLTDVWVGRCGPGFQTLALLKINKFDCINLIN